MIWGYPYFWKHPNGWKMHLPKVVLLGFLDCDSFGVTFWSHATFFLQPGWCSHTTVDGSEIRSTQQLRLLVFFPLFTRVLYVQPVVFFPDFCPININSMFLAMPGLKNHPAESHWCQGLLSGALSPTRLLLFHRDSDGGGVQQRF